MEEEAEALQEDEVAEEVSCLFYYILKAYYRIYNTQMLCRSNYFQVEEEDLEEGAQVVEADEDSEVEVQAVVVGVVLEAEAGEGSR